MKKLLAFLQNKWVVGIIGLTALSLLIWFGAEFIKFGADNMTLSPVTRAIIIGFFWLFWLTWNVSQWLVERRQNKELLGEIESSQQKDNDVVDPDQERSQEELAQMATRFRDALATLKKARFSSRRGKLSLYQLPWYIIIGPPGSGKTTALVNSGLEFPLADTHGKQALGGIGGTRNCDWWFTNDAVLIDTAGRYTTQDSHRVVDNNAWQAFLALLKKYRRRRPINGALIAISLQDLMVQTKEQREQQAKIIRARISELQDELGIRFPVYLTFTKGDLVAGFAEFFGNLSQAEREQVWGVSFPQEESENTGADISRFRHEFNQLVERLNERLLWRVQHERNTDKRAMIQGFPPALESLANVVDGFIQQTFAPNNYSTVPMLRGVYFTSATQEGSPIDRMMAQVSANFGLERSMGKQQHNSGKSFFITRLFRDVIFPESELVGVNRKIENLLRWMRRGAVAGLTGLLIGCAALWTGALVQNRAYMAEVDSLHRDYLQLRETIRPEQATTEEALELLTPLYQASLVYDQEEHPFISYLGLYDGRVDAAADQAYNTQLNQVFYPAVANMLERHLNALGADDSALLPVFRVYLMLFDQEHRDYEQIRAYAETRWQDLLPGEATKQSQLLTHLDHLIELGFDEQLQPDEYVVTRTRQYLQRIPVAQRLFAQLQKMGNNAREVDLYREIGGNPQQVFGLSENDPVFMMPFLFTKAGYDQAEYGPDSEMMKQIAADQWIYGGNISGEDYSKADLEKLSADVEKLYLTEYARRWQAFYQKFSLANLPGGSQSVTHLLKLADQLSSPLSQVTELVVKNTTLTPEIEMPTASGAAGGLVEKAAGMVYDPTLVDLRFRDIQRMLAAEKGTPSKFAGYLEAIGALAEYLGQIDGAPDSNAAAFEAAKKRFSGGGADAIQQLKNLAATAPDQPADWLNKLADQTWGAVMGKAGVHLNTVWRYQVYETFRNTLGDRYPLVAGRQSEASVVAFNEFFKPGGIQQAFVDEYVSPFVDTYRWKQKGYGGFSIGLSSEALRQFQRADDIRRAWFSEGEAAAINFRATPEKLHSNVRLFTMEIGENRISYSHGPRIEKSLNWIAGESGRSRIVFEDLGERVSNDQYDGDWSLLRMIDDAQLHSTVNKSEKVITFTESGYQAQYRLAASTNVNPFDLSLLRNFRCPQSL